MEENQEFLKDLKPGEKLKDETRGWFIVNDDKMPVYLKEDKEAYIATYKQYHKVEVRSETFSEVAKRIIWANTDEKNG